MNSNSAILYNLQQDDIYQYIKGKTMVTEYLYGEHDYVMSAYIDQSDT